MSRTRWLIEPKVQMKLIFLTMAINFLSLLVFAGALKFYFMKFIEAAQAKGLTQDHVFFQYIELQEAAMWRVFFIVTAISLSVSLIVTVVFSHRFVGPLKRLKDHLLQYGQSRSWKRIEFRKKDYWSDFGDVLNQIFDKKS